MVATEEILIEDKTAGRSRRRTGVLFVVLIPALVLYAVTASYFNWLGLIVTGALADPVVIEVTGSPDPALVAVTSTTSRVNPVTGRKYESALGRVVSQGKITWFVERGWVSALHLDVADGILPRIDSVRVRVGPVSRIFKSADLLSVWKRLESERWALTSEPGTITSLEIPWDLHATGVINWPAFPSLLWKCAGLPAGVALSLAFLLILAWRYGHRIELGRLLEDKPQGRRSGQPFRLSMCAGFMVVILGLGILYAGSEPYPFTQDDNFCQFLPVVLRSAETLATGRFPVWNPYQLMGAPTTTIGTYALTYPPTYISYWIAHSLLRDDYSTLEVFAIMHLFAGYFCCFYAMRKFGVSPPLCAAGSFCWVLSGWFLVAGRSQFNFTPIAAYLPLLVNAVNRLARGPVGWKWAFGTGAIIGLLFHAGHAEMWVYAMLFTSLAACLQLVSGRLGWRRLLWCVAAVFTGIGIAAPLLLLQKAETDGIFRQAGWGWSADLLHMLLPLGKVAGANGVLGSVNHEFVKEMFYSGTVFTLAGLCALALWLGASLFQPGEMSRSRISGNIWLLCAGLALLLAFGSQGVLWSVLAKLPLFEKFRWSVKYTPFMQLFMIFAGAAILQRCLARYVHAGVAARSGVWISVAAAALMLFHVNLCRATWYTFADRPFPKLATVPPEGRSLSITPFRSPSRNLVQSLTLNFPTQYKVLAVGGYDTFIGTKPEYGRVSSRLITDPVEAARAYGIRWVAWSPDVDNPRFSGNNMMVPDESTYNDTIETGLAVRDSAQPVAVSSGAAIFRAGPADPIAFATGHPETPLPYEADQAGARVRTAGLAKGTPLTVNFLRWRWITAEADGHPLAVHSDKWDRIEVTLPSPSSTVTISYSPPWKQSTAVGLCLILAAIATGLAAGYGQTDLEQEFA